MTRADIIEAALEEQRTYYCVVIDRHDRQPDIILDAVFTDKAEAIQTMHTMPDANRIRYTIEEIEPELPFA